MSRFKMPPRVAPSPAAGEPGLQNAAARLRSSRDVQARLLKERRATAEPDMAEDIASERFGKAAVETATSSSEEDGDGDGDGDGGIAVPTCNTGDAVGKPNRPGKRKLIVLFRLPLTTAARIGSIQGASGLSGAYVLKALAKEGRAALRELKGDADLEPLLGIANDMRSVPASRMTVGEAMTVYLRQGTLDAMHSALGDPWLILPKATVVGAFLAAIVTRLIEARLER
jgi:hypothetical protein